MSLPLRDEIKLKAFDKLCLGVIVGIALLIGQYLVSREIEQTRSRLAYEQAVAEARITHLRTTWEAIHGYGTALADNLRSAPELVNAEEIMKRAEEFDENLSRCGIFLGREKVEKIRNQLGGAFLQRLIRVIKTGDEEKVEETLVQFQDDWMRVLDEMQKELAR